MTHFWNKLLPVSSKPKYLKAKQCICRCEQENERI